MTQVTVIGINIGKASLHVVGLNSPGEIQWKKFCRTQLMSHKGTLRRYPVEMKACCRGYHLALELGAGTDLPSV